MCIYVKNVIQEHQVICSKYDGVKNSGIHIDSLCVRTKIGNAELILDCIYRTPGCIRQELVEFCTRFREGVQPSLLDLCLGSDEKLIIEIKLAPPVGKSDHLVILAKAQLKLIPVKKIFNGYKNYWKANYLLT